MKFGKGVTFGVGVITEPDCEIGNDVFLANYCVLRLDTTIGNNCKIGHHCVFEGCTIGNRVTIMPLSYLARGMIVEDDVFIGPCFQSSNDNRIDHSRPHMEHMEDAPIIKRGARIAVGVTILPGIVIGENAFIGAGSLVTKNVPPYEIWYGHPAECRDVVPWDERI